MNCAEIWKDDMFKKYYIVEKLDVYYDNRIDVNVVKKLLSDLEDKLCKDIDPIIRKYFDEINELKDDENDFQTNLNIILKMHQV